jgi:hypothetical protein
VSGNGAAAGGPRLRAGFTVRRAVLATAAGQLCAGQSAPARHLFGNVRMVLAANWPKVLGGAIVAISGAFAAGKVPAWLRLPVRCTAGAAGWFTTAGLAASWWVYDMAGLYRWTWLRALVPAQVRRHMLVTAGVDGVTPALAQLFPDSAGLDVDILDPRGPMKAPIRRARGSSQGLAIPVRPRELPVPAASIDLLLAPFSAHELRDAADRQALFREASRVLRAGGRMILVEHHRDLPNLLVFGPAAWHFYPRAEWEQAAARAGLQVVARQKLTPLGDRV